MIKPKILVARRIPDDILAQLQTSFEVEHNQADAHWSADELAQRLAGIHGVFITAGEPMTAAVIATAGALKAICTMAVGHNNIDLAACRARGITVTNAPDVLTETTADFGFALLLATARRVCEAEHFLRSGKWGRWSYDSFVGSDVHGATLGIVGMGRIGLAIARRAACGFDMQVLYCNRSRLSSEQEQLGMGKNARHLSKTELLQTADHVLLVLPYSAATHHTIGAAELALMKPSACLINLARGGIVDDAALAQALAERRIAAAGLDVFEGEPQVHSGLLAVPNVVLTPHIASASLPTRRAMAQLAADNLLAVLNGKPALTAVQ